MRERVLDKHWANIWVGFISSWRPTQNLWVSENEMVSLRKTQISELVSKLFSKLETLRFYSLLSLASIQSSKSVNPSAMNWMFVSPQNSCIEKPNPQGNEAESRDKRILSQQRARTRTWRGPDWARKPEGPSASGVGVTRAEAASGTGEAGGTLPCAVPSPTRMRSFSFTLCTGVTSRFGEESKSGNT